MTMAGRVPLATMVALASLPIAAAAPAAPPAPAAREQPAAAAQRIDRARPRPPVAGPALRRLALVVGTGHVVDLGGAAQSVVVARPEVADVQVPTPGSLFVFAKLPGRTTVEAFGHDGRVLAAVDVVVTPDLARLDAGLAAMPGAAARAVADGGAVRLDGDVATPLQAADAVALALQAAGKPELVGGNLRVAASTQVNLRVRVAEVSRSLTRELGFNWASLIGLSGSQILLDIGRQVVGADGTTIASPIGADSIGFRDRGGSTDLNAVIDALAQDGLVSILAEPNLTARSGETASFLSGGEFPIPIDNRDNSVTVEFKQFGVSLDFTPTVLDDGRISLKVRPEVSELDQNSGIAIGGLKIPGLRVRRAETTVELGSGQSFAIAGLVQANSTNALRAFPGLGDIPVLGALFRSTRFQRQETELVIMVTPYLVRPVPSPQRLAVPTDAVDPATGFKSLLLGRIDTAAPGPTRAADDVGFILE